MKPVIGIMPLVDDERESLWMLPGYMDGIAESGGLPLMLPLTDDAQTIEQLAGMCDGFIFTGGQDVSPELYGEEPLADLIECCRQRDEMEKIVLDIAARGDIPVLGICRGLQFINAALGGTLYQDLPSMRPGGGRHLQKPPYDAPLHKVNVVKNSPLHELTGQDILEVNSLHHQAVKDLSFELLAMAYSEDGLVEAFYMPGHKFLWAVQWHPEFAYKKDPSCRKLFQILVEKSESRNDQ